MTHVLYYAVRFRQLDLCRMPNCDHNPIVHYTQLSTTPNSARSKTEVRVAGRQRASAAVTQFVRYT
jgi:hypothetical protein